MISTAPTCIGLDTNSAVIIAASSGSSGFIFDLRD